MSRLCVMAVRSCCSGINASSPVREGTNVRRDFDGFRFTDKIGEATIDFIDVGPTVDSPNTFDDYTNPNQHLKGVYATSPAIGSLKIDVYWLNYENLKAKFRGLTGAENRDTFGTRWFGKSEGFDWNFEAATLYRFRAVLEAVPAVRSGA